ncbi:DUF4082 domain-containing protein [Microbacterium aerolatum]|uniref:DUF4082 domain-containing protein n=1 Tax=Microbacterium aerolatum TaxID=153731 RepID=UPI00384E1A5D
MGNTLVRRGKRPPLVGRAVAALATVLALVASGLTTMPAPAEAVGSSCGPDINLIACENSKPGTDPDDWDIDGAGDPSIQGFATDISVNRGARIDFKIDTDADDYTIDIYRTGWYQGLGARFIQSVPVTAPLPQDQDECIDDEVTELYDCGTWDVSASWDVPEDAVSGVYVAKLTREDTEGSSHIIFIVRDDGSHSDIVFQTSDPTWQAYNTYGGSSFYQGAGNGRAYKLSYNRPFATRNWVDGRDFYFSSEYATVRFLERNGYDISYISGIDSDRYGEQLLGHDVFLSVGHDEYWSGAQRTNVEAARDAGVNLQFLSGNEVYWRTRYEPSADDAHTPYRTLVSYKETWSNKKIDPTTEWTGTWRDPRFADAGDGGTLPENALTGTMYMSNDTDLALTVSEAEGKTRLWRNTSLASLPAGTTQALAPHTVGYESDEDIDNGFRPEGLVRLSTTVGAAPQYLTDYGNEVVPGTTKHHVTLYRAASGALVFGAGTIQWGWGLDQTHDGDGAPADVRMQQAQVNLLADMGAQPSTRMSGLAAAAASSDITAPVATITSPAEGASIPGGSKVIATGTASDVGGVVAGVEVSTDDGETWHPATGTTSWSYTYNQQGAGAVTLRARAIDDSANFSVGGTARSITVTPPYSALGDVVPVTASTDDPEPVELGLQFTPTDDGFVSGVRFYKGPANTGTHVGSLWSTSGERLASVTFTDETASGWQSALFETPVEVIAGQKYVVSYTAPNGGYAADADYWPYRATASTPVSVASGVGAAAPGVFGTPGKMPSSTWYESNYYVDVLFDRVDGSPLRILSATPVKGSSSNPTSTQISVVFSRALLASSLTMTVHGESDGALAGATSYDPDTRTATFTPSEVLAAGAVYAIAVDATDQNGVGLAEGSGTWTFSTAAAALPDGTCPCSLFTDLTRPDIASAADTDSVTLGVKFSSSQTGEITALRFYKGAANGGTHTGKLWSENGIALATVVYSGESTQGWQTATLSTPVPVTAGTTYVASYTAPVGGYAVTGGGFANAYSRGPLTVPAAGAVFTYGGGMPDQSSTTDYAVDVVFEPHSPRPNLVSTTPRDGAIDVATGTAISAVFDAPLESASITVTNGDAAVAGTTVLSGDGKTISFEPAAALPSGASLRVELTDVVGADGVDAQDAAWTFTTVSASGAAVVKLFDDVPNEAATATDDPDSVILGMSFTTDEPGQIRALRFYKAPTNTGTHIGWLWGSGSTPLAAVMFSDETASGWQRAELSEPVDVVPGRTYTVSYLAPNGNYTYLPGGFATPAVRGPLTADAASNGVYRYGESGRPTTVSASASNYFVDVEFVAGEVLVPETLFGDTVPAVQSTSDNDAVEIGTAFTVAEPGEVTAIRFYKGAANSGTHVGTLWDGDRTALATVTFTDETASGWQRAVLSDPVSVSPGATYVVSYLAPNGHYSSTPAYFTSDRVSGSITAPGGANGRYLYGAAGGYPTYSWNSTAYFVDAEIAFGSGSPESPPQTPEPGPSPTPTPTPEPTPEPTPDPTPTPTPEPEPAQPLAITAREPASAAIEAAPTTTVTATLSVDAPAAVLALVTGTAGVAGASVYDPQTRTVTFTPEEPFAWSTAYTATLTAGDAQIADGTWSFTTAEAPPIVDVTNIFGDATPQNSAWNDPDGVQVATRFSVDVAGSATGIRFYKGAANTGDHTGYLWDAEGVKLAEVQFADETADGWQTAALSTPLDLLPGVEYRVGLYGTTGRYAVDLQTLAAETVVGHFTIPASGSSWIYSREFPSNLSTNNYWVDVLFDPVE